MEECEICGRPTSDIYVVEVENVEMRVDARCAKGKKVIRTEFQKDIKKKGAIQAQRPKKEDEVLIEGYGTAIRRAREGMKLPIRVLAEMLNEKEHLLVRIEEEKTRPTIELTAKLEKALSIKLTEQASEGDGAKKAVPNSREGKATIGDFINP